MIILKLIVPVLFFVAVQGYERKGYPGYVYQDQLEGWLKLHKKPTTWQQAVDICIEEGAVLVTSQYDELDETLIEFLKDKQVPLIFVGSRALSAPRKPDAEISNETVQKSTIVNCVAIHANNASKTSVDCNAEFPFVCYAPRPEDPDCDLTKLGQDREGWPGYHRCKDIDGYVKIHPESGDFDKARDTCEEEGGHILDIGNPKYRELALKMLKANSSNIDLSIFGKTRIMHPNGGFKVVDGKKKYVKYLPPYCTRMSLDGILDRQADCDDKHAFICFVPFDDNDGNGGDGDDGKGGDGDDGKDGDGDGDDGKGGDGDDGKDGDGDDGKGGDGDDGNDGNGDNDEICEKGKPRKGHPDYKSCKDITGWVKIHPGPSDYDDAKDTCEKEGGQILDANNPNYLKVALEMLKKNGNDGKPIVIFGKNKTAVSDNGFHEVSGKTKFIGKQKLYCSLLYPNGTIDLKADCNRKFGFICYVPYDDDETTKEGSCDGATPRAGHPDYKSCKDIDGWVKVHPDPTDYHDAKDKCKSEGGKIIDANHEKYQKIVFELMKIKPGNIKAIFHNSSNSNNNGFSKVGGETKFFRKNMKFCSILHSDGTIEENVDCDTKLPFICYVPFPDDDENKEDGKDGNEGDGKDGNEGDGKDGNEGDGKDGNKEDGKDGNEGDAKDENKEDGKDGNEGDGKDGNKEDGKDGNEGDGKDGNKEDGKDGNDGDGKDGNEGDGKDGNEGDDKDGNKEDGKDGNEGDGEDGNDGDGKDGNKEDGIDGNEGDGKDGNEGGNKDKGACEGGIPRKGHPDYKSCKDDKGWVKVHPEPATHDEAKKKCESEGGELLDNKDPKLVELALKLMKENDDPSILGKAKKTFPGGGFKVVDGKKKFVKNLPPECTIIYVNGTINDRASCDDTSNFICFVPFPDDLVIEEKKVCDNSKPRKGHPDYLSCKDDDGWVKIHPEPSEHDDAEEKCEEEGGKLLDNGDPKQLELALKLLKEKNATKIFGKTKETLPGGFKILDYADRFKDNNFVHILRLGNNQYVELLPPECTIIYANGTIDPKGSCDETMPFICYVPFEDDKVVETKKVCEDGKPRQDHPDYQGCPEIEGWIKVHPGPSDFDEAKDSCNKEGGEILDPSNPEHKKIALELMKEHNVDGKPIIIFGKNKTLQPDDGFNQVDGNTKFGRKEKEYCSLLYPNGTIDAKAECDSKLSFICYVPYPKDSCDGGPPRKNHPDYKSCKNITGWVKVHPEPTDYDDARSKCDSEGAEILDTSNPEFNRIALELMKNTGKTSITIFSKNRKSLTNQGFHKVGGETKFIGRNTKLCTLLNIDGTTKENVPCGSKSSFICYVPFSKKEDETKEVKKEVCVSGKPRTGYPDYKSCVNITGWVKINPGPSDYDEAKDTCKKEGGDLIDIDNPTYLEVALDMIKKNNDGKPIVIFGKTKSLYPDDGFNPVEGQTKFIRKSKEFCSLLYPNGTIEHKADCKSKVSYICYVPFPGEDELEDSCDGAKPREGHPGYKSCKDITGWVKVHPGPSDYNDAKNTCNKEGGEIFDPTNLAHKKIALELMEKSRISTGNPLMIFRQNKTTVTGNGFNPVGGKTKFIGKPKALCSLMYPNGKIEDNVDCGNKLGFICYVPFSKEVYDCGAGDYRLDSKNGRCYKIHTIGKNWEESRKQCISEGGDLTVIKSIEQADLLMDIYKNHDDKYEVYRPLEIFVGAKLTNGSWKTINGEALKDAGYDHWANDYRKPNRGREMCGCINMNAKYVDCWCDVVHGYMCQKNAATKVIAL